MAAGLTKRFMSLEDMQTSFLMKLLKKEVHIKSKYNHNEKGTWK